MQTPFILKPGTQSISRAWKDPVFHPESRLGPQVCYRHPQKKVRDSSRLGRHPILSHTQKTQVQVRLPINVFL